MFLAGVDISKTAYFIKAQSVWQMVTKLIPYDDVTQFDGIWLTLTNGRRIKGVR